MAKSQVVVFLDVVGLNPIGIPASHERLDKCYEVGEVSGETLYFFPKRDNPTHVVRMKSVVMMFLQDTPRIAVPQGPVPQLARA